MKKYFIFIILLVAGVAFVACDKGKDQNNPDNSQENTQTNPQDSTEKNPYPYMRYADLEPLLMISLSKAEEHLAKMGYKGGFQSYTYYEDGKQYKEDRYLYTPEDKMDSIMLFPNSDGIIEEISYNACKGVIPSEAKAWLTHIPENVTIPERIAKIVGENEMAFMLMREWEKDEIKCSTYSEYVDAINNKLSSGMFIDAWWGKMVNPSALSGYYGGFMAMRYKYINNVDWANLGISYKYHTQREPEPVVDPTDN